MPGIAELVAVIEATEDVGHTLWCRALACNGSIRAAMGSTLLRSPGRINPVQ